ncbi:hypothetical protein MTR_5g008575 [Medicago truncatula]|uniref:Uncharacterized protein n=1 Tax=Medicago truncatula TaxID=3880 RepID=A0A072UC95_MEDTR|nr:hypothetical protein MTR_5g008575 [Medicago truncatula]
MRKGSSVDDYLVPEWLQLLRSFRNRICVFAFSSKVFKNKRMKDRAPPWTISKTESPTFSEFKT